MTDISRQKLLEIGGILIALLLPLAFNPFSSQPSEGIKVTILQAITSLMVIACVISSFIKHSTRSKPAIQGGVSLTVSAWFKDNPLLLPVIIYTGVYIIATIISIDQPQSFWGTSIRQGTLTIMFLVVFFIMIAGALRSSIQVDRLISTLIVVSVPVAIYGWLQYFGLDPLDWDITSLSPVHSTVGYSLYQSRNS